LEGEGSQKEGVTGEFESERGGEGIKKYYKKVIRKRKGAVLNRRSYWERMG